MIINNGFGFNQLNIRPDTAQQTRADAGTGEGNAPSSTSSSLSGLSGGDTITGQIVGRSGNDVQIAIGPDSVINAKLGVAADLNVGSSVTFTVMNSDSSGITLSPLLTNTDLSSPVNTALMNAGLANDLRNIEMVNAMMERGMPVGKEELAKMTMSLAGIPDMDIGDAVMLKSLGINPTPDNIEQFHAYQGYEHQVSAAVNEIMDMVPQAISDMISEGDTSGAIDMARDILDIFTGQGAMEPMNEQELRLSGMEAPINTVLTGDELNELADLLTENGIDPEFAQSMANGEVSLNDVMYIIDDIVNSKAGERGAQDGMSADIPLTDDMLDMAKEASDIAAKGAQDEAAGASGERMGQTESTDASGQNVSSGSAGLDFLNALKSDSVNSDTLNSAIHTAADINKHAATDSILKLIGSKPMAAILGKAVDDQWKLTPGQVGEDKQVTDLYKRMTEQTGRLIDALNHHAKEDSPLANSVNELSKNMNFMNELNNMFNYIQLPMKLSGNDTHGELYVYSNKKHMAHSDGTVSALLHLDMDNLGPTDVYVTMNSSNHVNTHFYLPDEESLDLIAAHIDELNARIERRGYSCSAEISKREEMTNMMTEIIEDNKSVVPVSISNFDARA